MRKIVLLPLLVIIVGICAAAQSNELAFIAGVKATPAGSAAIGTSNEVSVDKSFAFEASYAHQLRSVPLVALQLELPVVAVPDAGLNKSNILVAKSYTSIYFTPGFRLKFATAFPVNPWVSAGGGLAHFNPSSTNTAGGPSGATSTTKGAFQVGAGLDFKAPAFPIALRVEAREFYAGAPNIGLPKLDLHHNVFIGGGIVLRF